MRNSICGKPKLIEAGRSHRTMPYGFILAPGSYYCFHAPKPYRALTHRSVFKNCDFNLSKSASANRTILEPDFPLPDSCSAISGLLQEPRAISALGFSLFKSSKKTWTRPFDSYTHVSIWSGDASDGGVKYSEFGLNHLLGHALTTFGKRYS